MDDASYFNKVFKNGRMHGIRIPEAVVISLRHFSLRTDAFLGGHSAAASQSPPVLLRHGLKRHAHKERLDRREHREAADDQGREIRHKTGCQVSTHHRDEKAVAITARISAMIPKNPIGL